MGPLAEGNTPLFDRLAHRYDAWFEGDEGRLIFQIELEAIRAAAQTAPRPWLEVGVGSGRFASALGIDVGIDPSEKLLEMAHARGVRTIRGRGERLPFADGSFGTVFLIVTICFVDDPMAVLQECRRVLRSGGKLILGFVPRESPWGKRYSRVAQEGHPFYSHARFYTIDEAERLLGEAGFAVEGATSTLFQPPGHVERLEPPRPGRSGTAGFVVFRARA